MSTHLNARCGSLHRRIPAVAVGTPASGTPKCLRRHRTVRDRSAGVSAGRWLALCFLILLINRPLAAQSEPGSAVQKQIEALLTPITQGPLAKDDVEQLFNAAVTESGSTESLLEWLEAARRRETGDRANRLTELEAMIAARRGELDRALGLLTKLLAETSIVDSRLDLRLWQARLYDAEGKIAEAREAYQSLTESELTETDQQMVRLRLALMGLLGSTDERQVAADAKPLIELAERSEDAGFRNRAANVLAVQNQHAAAIKLFEIRGEGTERFRSASRFTEWAIRAGEREQAIAAAWDAVQSAQIRRDRRYALALLVEAYRLQEEAQGLEQLVKSFAEKDQQQDPVITAELRQVWVSLLRELGQFDEAIALFKSSAAAESGFTIAMRRELLEMEGEAGNRDQMLASYRNLIAEQPHELTWRGGLTRLLLEQGDDAAATALWSDYISSLNDATGLLLSTQTLAELGLDQLVDNAVERMVRLDLESGQALLFLAELHRKRGRLQEAEATLNRLHQLPNMEDGVLAELAGAFERIGRQDKAVEVMEGIRSRRETVAEDLEMRLAWLYSEIGDEEKALQQWLSMWRKINSVARRRYVEDRIMTVASRLGTLADIAIELEEKLMDGKADDREAGLLVRIYSRVNDSVAASEILEEYMTQTGRDEVDRLQEKGRIYQICNDYWNYEKVIERLIEIDPEGETEYLRQLALSMLERGKAQEARSVLMKLRDAQHGQDSIGGEFEAGVLSLVGLNEEAADAYRRGIANHPDRIESYLLLANLLRDMGETERAVGMFQYLAETADRDDLFTIAIDGLLNMEADARVVQWARRITLERLAGREDKNYLYQLLSDLSAEVNDKQGQIRALENSLAVSGTRRVSVLRECMDLSSNIRGGAFYSSSSRSRGNAGNKPFFAFGRRLIGLGELMPPQVFLDLGQAFLADGDVVSAERTFAMARNLADERSFERDVAAIFEQAGHRPQALERYERLLRTSPSDVALMARVAKLNEQEGHDAAAARFYERGHNLLLAQTPLTTQEKIEDSTAWSYGGNRDAYQTYSDRLLRGLLVTTPAEAVDRLLEAQERLLTESLTQLAAQQAEGQVPKSLNQCPRIEKRSESLRRMQFAFGRIEQLAELDETLITHFPNDTELPTTIARERIEHGRFDLAYDLLDMPHINPEQRRSIQRLLGISSSEELAGQQLSPKEMWSRLLPVWIGGDIESARKILRSVDVSGAQGNLSTSNQVQYTYVMNSNGMLVRQQLGWENNISIWIQQALALGDEGLALQFARTRLQKSPSTGVLQTAQTFAHLKAILPRDSYLALARYAANLYSTDEKRTFEYLWLANELGGQLASPLPTDEEILEQIAEQNLRLSYYQFPFAHAVKMLPESIRSDAIASLIDNVMPKLRPRELFQIPLQTEEPIDEELQQVLLDSLAEGIEAAVKEDYLRYTLSSFPRQPPMLKNQANADLALTMLESLDEETVGSKHRNVTDLATMVRGIVLLEAGRTAEAIEIGLAAYGADNPSSDYYVRNAREWLLSELFPIAAERFLAIDDAQRGTGKRTTTQTDQRLALLKKVDNDELLRAAFEEAWKDHPGNSRFPQQYEAWERQNGRLLHAVRIIERQLEQLQQQEDPSASRISELQRQLAGLWFRLQNPVAAVQLWAIQDDRERAEFEEQRAARTQAKPPSAQPVSPSTPEAPPSVRRGTSAARAQTATPRTPATAVRSAATRSTSADRRLTPARRGTVSDLKRAMDKNELDTARRILRELWRAFPAVQESPYRRVVSSSSISRLTWPSTSKPRTVPEPAADSQQAARVSQRTALRGGLTALEALERASNSQPGNSDAGSRERLTLWERMASEPFGVDEMQRLVRSRTPSELPACDTVLVGLLKADRIEHGDQAVFQSLFEAIRRGQSGHRQQLQLVTLLDEQPQLIGDLGDDAIDDLVQHFQAGNLRLLSRLAWLCAKTGHTARAEALYVHCAMRAGTTDSTQVVSFRTLLTEAREVFPESEFHPLAERMFAAVPHRGEATTPLILDLRSELLGIQEAADRSRPLFEELANGSGTIGVRQATSGAIIFSRGGQFDIANLCLRSILLRNRTQTTSRLPIGLVRTSTTRIQRSEMLRLYPAPTAADYTDYAAWLDAASAEIAQLLDHPQVDALSAIDQQLMIAHRFNQLGDLDAAVRTLDTVKDRVLSEAPTLAELAIDVLREAEQRPAAWELESKLYRQGELSAVRFGDLLQDTYQVRGQTEAAALLEELLKVSLDADLLAAARQIAPEDSTHLERIERLQQQADAAYDDYDRRIRAAHQRTKTRQEWSDQAKAKAADSKDQ